MISAVRRNTPSFQAYLALEEASNTKHEYLAGEIYAMAGGTPEHAALAANLIGMLSVELRGKPCRVYTSDLRVRVNETGLTTYPDVSVVCGEIKCDPENASTVLNPSVLIEVLGDSTEKYDRGEKFEHYKQIKTLETYMLVSHQRPLVELYRRDGDAWASTHLKTGEMFFLDAIDCQLSVDDVYDGIFV